MQASAFKGRLLPALCVTKVRLPNFCMLQVKFEGEKWENVSEEAIDLVRRLLDRDYSTRISAAEALHHPWILSQCGNEGCIFEEGAVDMMPVLSER